LVGLDNGLKDRYQLIDIFVVVENIDSYANIPSSRGNGNRFLFKPFDAFFIPVPQTERDDG
jgi:hypothetical protein